MVLEHEDTAWDVPEGVEDDDAEVDEEGSYLQRGELRVLVLQVIRPPALLPPHLK